MIYAPSGVGKSFLSLAIALAVASGGEVLGWRASKSRKVLIIDGEMDEHDHRSRASMLLEAMPDGDREAALTNLNFLNYQDQEPETWFPDIADEDGRDFVVEYATSLGAELVILDNFSTLATVDDENAASSFNPVIDLMRRLQRAGVSVILVHHSRKSSGGEGSYRGSQKMSVTFHVIIRLEHQNGLPSHDGLAFDMHFEKVRRKRTSDVESARVALTYLDGKPVWKKDPLSDGRLRDLVDLIRSRDYPHQAELAKVMDISKGQVTKLRHKAIHAGLISMDEWSQCLLYAKKKTSDQTADNDDL